MKHYFLVRWKKRWPVVPGAVILAIFAVLHSVTIRHDGMALINVVFIIVFATFVLLFPFRFGGEDQEDPSSKIPK